jgi:rubrerythrin
MKLPTKTAVPLPEITFTDESIPLSKILTQAMDAEHAAQAFYQSLAQLYIDNQQIYHILIYFADMELGHYKILEIEKQSMERFEEADVYWPMIHVGP